MVDAINFDEAFCKVLLAKETFAYFCTVSFNLRIDDCLRIKLFEQIYEIVVTLLEQFNFLEFELPIKKYQVDQSLCNLLQFVLILWKTFSGFAHFLFHYVLGESWLFLEYFVVQNLYLYFLWMLLCQFV